MKKLVVFALLAGCGAPQHAAETKIIPIKVLNGSRTIQAMQYKIEYDLVSLIKNINNGKIDKANKKLDSIYKEIRLINNIGYKKSIKRTDEMDFLAKGNTRYRVWSAHLQKRLEAVNDKIKQVELPKLGENDVITGDLIYTTKNISAIINELSSDSPYMKAAIKKYKEINDNIEDSLIQAKIIMDGIHEDIILGAIKETWYKNAPNPRDTYKSFSDYVEHPQTKDFFEQLGKFLEIDEVDSVMHQMWFDYNGFSNKIIDSINNGFFNFMEKESKSLATVWGKQEKIIENNMWDGLADWDGRSMEIWHNHPILGGLLATNNLHYVTVKFTSLFVKK